MGRRGAMADIDEIIDNFSVLDDWDDRYRYLIELGRELPPLVGGSAQRRQQGPRLRQPSLARHHRAPQRRRRPVLTFEGDSDAHIVRGLIAILFATYSGRTATDILATDAVKLFERHGPQGTSDAAALERLSLDGRAHPRRCARGAGAGAPKNSLPSPSDLPARPYC